MPIAVQVNGETKSVERGTDLAGLLASLEIPLNGVLVERNREIVGRDVLHSVTLEEGDAVEIIRMVSGG